MAIQEDITILPELKISPEDEDLVAKAYNRLLRWENDNDAYYTAALNCRKTLHLKDPDQDGNGEYETIQLQTLLSTFKHSVADQIDNMPEARMEPERPNMQAVAEDLTDVVKFIMMQNGYDSKLHRQFVEDFYGVGTCVAQVVWDPDMANGDGDVAIIRWPLESFVWDSSSENIQEARAIMKVSWHPLEWFKAHYEKGAYVGDEAGGQYGAHALPASQETVDDTEGKALLVEYWWRTYDRKKRKYTINCAHMAGGVLLEKYENVYAHGLYPFVAAPFSRIEGQPVGQSMVDELRPMMQYVNRYARYVDENIRMSAKIRMLVNKGAGIDEEALADWDRNVIQGDRIGEEAVRWLQSKPLNGMAVQQMLQFQTDIKQDSGQNQFTRGETAGGVTAATAISALQEAGGKITRMHNSALNQFFKDIVTQVLWLVSEFYTDKQVRMITGKDGNQRLVDMSADHLMGEETISEETAAQLSALPEDQQMEVLQTARRRTRRARRGKGVLPPPPYTVQIQVQRRNPLRIQAENELFIQAYTMSAQAGQTFPLHLLFELLNVDGKERILPILREADQQAQLLAQLQQQNAELQQSVENLQNVVDEQGKALRGTAGQPATAERVSQEQQVAPEAAMGGAAEM